MKDLVHHDPWVKFRFEVTEETYQTCLYLTETQIRKNTQKMFWGDEQWIRWPGDERLRGSWSVSEVDNIAATLKPYMTSLIETRSKGQRIKKLLEAKSNKRKTRRWKAQCLLIREWSGKLLGYWGNIREGKGKVSFLFLRGNMKETSHAHTHGQGDTQTDKQIDWWIG